MRFMLFSKAFIDKKTTKFTWSMKDFHLQIVLASGLDSIFMIIGDINESKTVSYNMFDEMSMKTGDICFYFNQLQKILHNQ